MRHWIKTWKPDRIVAVGGDGTVKLVYEQILGSRVVLGILPAGSANGMARELNIPLTVEASLDVVVQGMVKPIDVIRINQDDICIHLSDIGMNAQLVKYYQENNWRGKLGYARGVLKVLLRRRLLRVEIKTTNETVQRVARMIVLANASRYGTGAVINPEGDVADGLFEVVVIRKLALTEVLKMFWRYRPFDPGKTEIFKATSIHIETRKSAYFQVDGEYRGRVRQVDAEIVPGQLNVMLPKT
ncbi:MAG: diacylglycerol kinase family lipid kinase [Cytophagaceae bacterium]|nr:diacylglycerol kinase family lipid kinase [Cytophagaceae bacterium]